MDINYTEKYGILYPNFKRNKNYKPISSLGKYGRMALKHLKIEYPNRYLEMKINDELISTMYQVDKEANEMMITLQKQFLENNPIKNPNDFMESLKHRNSIRMQAEEIVLTEIVYRKR